jgi:hypothetical protein
MKNLFNEISQDEKNRILEMHSGKKNVISEQNSQQVYKEIADYLYKSMKGLSSSEDSENVETIILNRIKNKNDWEGVKKAFGIKDGENLDQWLKGELRLNYNDIMGMINKNDSNFKKEDSMYNPGSKIRLITNRQFIMSRAYEYASINKNKRELELDIDNATVIRRDKDGIVIKAGIVFYYPTGEYDMKKDSIPKQVRLDNPCIKIPFKDVIEWRDGTLQIRWFSDFVKSRVVPC